MTTVVTGQEDNEDVEEEDGASEEDSGAEEKTFKNGQPGPSGVSIGGIGVSEPEDHYSNPPSVSSIPSVRSRSRSYSPPRSRSYSPTSPGSPSSPLSRITITVPTRRRGRERGRGRGLVTT